jgi:UDP-glucose 4-epimerase
MRVLITGGAGFIGAALANRLAREGHHVRALDDLSAGNQERLDERVAFVRGDTRDVPRLWTLLRGIDCIYHLAARVSVPESVLYPVEYNDVNVGGTVSLLTAARDAQVKRLVFASSGAVYGEQHTERVSEAVSPNPDTPYAVSKAASEQYVRAIGRLWGIDTVILRIFNAYGPGQPLPPSHAPVVPRFLRQAQAGGSVVIFGQGQQVRDFVYLDDVVEALISAATSEDALNQVINVGSGQGVSIAGLVDTIEQVVGKEVHRLYNDEGDTGVSHLVADVSLARRKLRFEPRTSLADGLRRTLRLDARFARG